MTLPMVFALLIIVDAFLVKQHGISPKPTADSISRSTAGEGSSRFSRHVGRLAGYGFVLLALALFLTLLWPAPLGKPGGAGAGGTEPWWRFLWLFPAEEMW